MKRNLPWSRDVLSYYAHNSKKKTLYIKTWIKTTTPSTPEHSYICNAVPTFLKVSLINSNDEKKYTPSYLE